ncbi:unnamed protein product [Dovyalis caffra]|uniref:Ribosomal protein L32 n=1 Tax=Dovyalis caffra TaxID=77055 RepID=A0AAV1R972_9ROSI|nr:unnamed protein product [Dovyalis caffra]
MKQGSKDSAHDPMAGSTLFGLIAQDFTSSFDLLCVKRNLFSKVVSSSSGKWSNSRSNSSTIGFFTKAKIIS